MVSRLNPHADSSYFAAGASKEQVYDQVLEQATGLVTGQRNWVRTPRHRTSIKLDEGKETNTDSNLANVSSLLWHAYASLPKPSSAVNWAGFYVRDDLFPLLASPKRSNSISGLTTTTISTSYASHHDKKLLLGPFQGKPACQEIRFGRGVCGTAAQKKETVVVPDVLEFPGHIACDADSRSEIVVPILFEGETVAIIDIDCTEPAGFDEVDKKYLEQLAQLLADTPLYSLVTDPSQYQIYKVNTAPLHSPVTAQLKKGQSASSLPSSSLLQTIKGPPKNNHIDSAQRRTISSSLSTSTISSLWSADPPESPVPPWSAHSTTSLSKEIYSSDHQDHSVLLQQQHSGRHQQEPQQQQQQQQAALFDFSLFEHDSLNSSLQGACAAPDSTLDQFTGALDLDLLIDPTSAESQLSFDFLLDFGSDQGHPFDITTTSLAIPSKPATSIQATPSITIVEDLSSACSPANMPDGGSILAPSVDLVNMNMEHFYPSNTTSVSPNMASIPSRGCPPLVTQFQKQQQPLLAPKQHTPPSSSVSPALSHIHSIDLDISNSNTMQAPKSKKRSRAESTGLDLSSNNSAQDSEEERIVEKRRRNTMAARRFRQRKQNHVSELESQLSKVTKERDDLRLQVAKWEGEVMALRKLLEMKK
ncbi:GAF domain nucleotide-binding protein [Talaromyces stipitatus ATCC 10500]|uniref:GAF domain nucleotide-binding protein n=1 Tax=Talaromyces stipitatus (strain ATCC 10500 / CBS 375.48 / QM 6759 / NRRL 1006) TaxID=441959 RepID=B8M5D8_TALSN|nr:GAF domain nucleotide-binding protein [Talaromyces stipitatus ATCC 10500]EED19744.1 GAF domain nucleotide-binding protein [Talaromyces stipitatus ATCC 10500]